MVAAQQQNPRNPLLPLRHRIPCPLGGLLAVIVGLAACAVIVGVAACAGSARAACVRVPQTIPDDRLLTSGTNLELPVGATVFVVLVEPEMYSIGPGFPWMTPTSSNPAVLTPIRLCKSVRLSTLPLTVTGFRAVRPGTATITASLSARWRTRKTKPQPAIDHVTVK